LEFIYFIPEMWRIKKVTLNFEIHNTIRENYYYQNIILANSPPKRDTSDKTLAEENLVNLVTVLTIDLQAVKISPSIQANA
jgi:hypothetical protein